MMNFFLHNGVFHAHTACNFLIALSSRSQWAAAAAGAGKAQDCATACGVLRATKQKRKRKTDVFVLEPTTDNCISPFASPFASNSTVRCLLNGKYYYLLNCQHIGPIYSGFVWTWCLKLPSLTVTAEPPLRYTAVILRVITVGVGRKYLKYAFIKRGPGEPGPTRDGLIHILRGVQNKANVAFLQLLG